MSGRVLAVTARLKTLLRGRDRYALGQYDIELPAGHRLPEYQALHPLYDRFLPRFCRELGEGLVVDVGANVGDTAIAIAQECANPILSIEGHPPFFCYLKRNAALMPGRIRPICALVGRKQTAGTLVADNTTAHRSVERRVSKGDDRSIPLHELLEHEGKLALLKIDTDGSDADVLLSVRSIAASKPILFWENYYASEQREEFEEAYDALRSLGYRYLWLFDNFGNLMLPKCTFNDVRKINDYVLTQATRTIFYTDVLASTRHISL